ncbi:hypothetical protein FACS1894116_10850 [Betaproteobacteria bacterium]|nr:hypothetical protein AGMMS49543_22360 [Betaproteobacteria bacterium]GHT95398.1 hypothetical protein FACS1894116_10850 [Betaproteobacteria bacterium]GHT98300.1 hypothetical protein AGMMS49960_01090 [Betaproteobacteria bacterium]GHU23178.1 hypothetical protein AGMMS50243_24120 [Betaproteobacteria bacterium]GHU30348.1 hypothetical protein FACS189497_09980 [Betaproteobacteria bacterium]
MELEIYQGFKKAGVSDEDAQAIVESINKAIDQRYAVHSQQLATQGDVEKVRADIEKAKAEIIKWILGSMIGAVGLALTMIKIFITG